MPRLFAAMLALFVIAAFAAPACAEDLNSFRRAHGRRALALSSTLTGLAYEQAHSMAGRNRLDHDGFRQRFAFSGGTHAENVAVIACARPDAKPVPTFAGRACGCADEDCAIKIWVRSAGHRANMLRGDVSAYGLASATGANGRTYWALELGN